MNSLLPGEAGVGGLFLCYDDAGLYSRTPSAALTYLSSPVVISKAAWTLVTSQWVIFPAPFKGLEPGPQLCDSNRGIGELLTAEGELRFLSLA